MGGSDKSSLSRIGSKSWIRVLAVCSIFVGSLNFNLLAADGSDNAGNYTSWNSGDNQGTGFGPWTFENNNNGTNAWAGVYLADPNNPGSRTNGIFSSSTSGKAFALYANPSGAYMVARRTFGGSNAVPLAIGESFSFKWLQYWGGGNKGINLFRDGWDDNNDRTVSLRQDGDPFVVQPRGSTNSPTAISNAYNNVTSVKLRRAGPDTLVLTVQTDDPSDGSYTNTFRAPAPDRVSFYFSNGANGSNDEPLFNDLAIDSDVNPVATRNVKFSVNMGVLEGATPTKFNSESGDKVFVRGYPSGGWGGTEKVELLKESGSVYSATIQVAGDTRLKSGGFKFFIEPGTVGGTPIENGGYETIADREFDLTDSDTNLPVVYFNNILPTRNVTFTVDMNVQKSKSTFDPVAQGVELKGNFNGWGAGVAMSDLDGDGIYTATVSIQGSVGDSIEYKFNTTGTGATGWETLATNRTLVLGGVAETLKPVTFSNDGTTFAVWSGGAELNSGNLAKYAIGGTTDLTASDGIIPVLGGDATTLTLTAIIRDDTSLNVAGEAVTSLEDFNTPSSIVNATVENAADQTLLPANCKRKVFSVARGTDDKKFLRIRVTK